MRVLVADDEVIFRRMVRSVLVRAGHDVVEAADGDEARRCLDADDAPPIAILDWMMPGADGVDLCRALRARERQVPPYLILLTSKDKREDVVSGLDAGADDYLTKPFDPSELRARVQVGERILALQQTLADRVLALEQALGHVRQLQGLLPICAWCHKIREDGNYWQSVERYVSERSDARFTHTICPECRPTVMSVPAGNAR
jgi:sigma-B regulation protein RsbU (phosphoserine phosphatase)